MVDSTTSSRFPSRGVVALTGTPLNPDFSINEGAIQEQVDWFVDRGAAALWVDGHFGECNKLDEEVRVAAHARFAEAAASRVYLGAGCYGINPFQSIRLANHAQTVGYDMAWLPAPWKGTDDEIYDFFEFVHERTTISLGIYNSFAFDVYMRPSLVARIAELERFVCMKEVNADFDHLAGLHNYGVFDRLSVYASHAITTSLELGAAGPIVGPVLFEVATEIFDLYERGEVHAALIHEASAAGRVQAQFAGLSYWAWGADAPPSKQPAEKAKSGEAMGIDLGPAMIPV